MCSISVLCPLCAQTSFSSIDALRHSLIKAANGPLECPLCHELFLGLDKLTIHLFSHTSNMTTTPGAADATEKAKETMPASESKAQQSVVNAKEQPTALSAKERRTKNTKIKAATKQQQQQQQQQPELQAQVNCKELAQEHVQQQQQQQQFDLYSDALATCDICEFTFRNAELRDIHFRLVHQSFDVDDKDSCSPAVAANCLSAVTGTCEPGFKCHLCAKRFKLKVHLKVHLKVVHVIGLAHFKTGSPKLSICDRIRHKETKMPLQPLGVQAPPPALQQHAAFDNSNAPAQINAVNPAAFSLGTLTLLPTPLVGADLATCVATSGVLNLNGNGELVQPPDAASLRSNVLLVLNTNSGEAVTLQSEMESNMDNHGELNAFGIQDTNTKIWECDVCTKAFTTKYFLKKHKRLHTGEMPYTCEICARSFTFQQSYHKHLLYHSDDKPHVCSICGRAFKELSTLHNHERIHSGEKPFKCEVCGKCFRQRVSFLVHTRIHTGIMPYKCEQCQKSFRYKVSQRTHKCLITHPDTEPTTEQISDNFIKAFLESTTAELAESALKNPPTSDEIAAIAADCNSHLDERTVLDEALLSKAIDDIVVESCHKLGIGSNHAAMTSLSNNLDSSVITDFNSRGCSGDSGGACGDGSSPPLQKLQNMHIYSPQMLEAAHSDEHVSVTFPQFLLDDANNNLL